VIQLALRASARRSGAVALGEAGTACRAGHLALEKADASWAREGGTGFVFRFACKVKPRGKEGDGGAQTPRSLSSVSYSPFSRSWFNSAPTRKEKQTNQSQARVTATAAKLP
jgi:hypothetical protein